MVLLSDGTLDPQFSVATILPARTLDAHNFLNKQAKATKLGEFSPNLVNAPSIYLSIKFDVIMATTF